jgi:hypothetical protein
MPILPFDPKDLYYVIIGCGFSAITNHSTLQQMGHRLQDLKVLHIGAPDPWADYHAMPMGQWPLLLALPGYRSQLANITRSACLGSDEFGAANQAEWDRLSGVRPFAHINERVTAVKSTGTPPSEYEVVLDDVAHTVVRAAYVDVCAGPGPANVPPASVTIDPVLIGEYETASRLPGLWPRLLSGEKYLSKSAGAWATKKFLCVIGGGPTSAWCVERAQSQGNQILWLSKDSLNTAFVSSRRNDDLVAGIIERELVQGEHIIKGSLLPRKTTTIFAEGFEVTAITALTSNKIRVDFQPISARVQRYVNSLGTQAYPASVDVDQVVYSIGQNTEITNPKSWPYIMASVLSGAISKGTHLIKDRYDRAVGLQSEDQRIRVLGATALSHPTFQSQITDPDAQLRKFYRSLTEQSRVRGGITFAALTIAEANGFWGATAANENLNTAGLEDLKSLMTSWDKELKGPETWLEMRGIRVPPLKESEFASLLTRKTRY